MVYKWLGTWLVGRVTETYRFEPAPTYIKSEVTMTETKNNKSLNIVEKTILKTVAIIGEHGTASYTALKTNVPKQWAHSRAKGEELAKTKINDFVCY